MMTMSRRRAGWLRPVGLVVAALLLVAVSFWAGRVTLTPQEAAVQAPDSFVDVEVVQGEVGRVLTVSTTVRRGSVPLAQNRLSGTVTHVAATGEMKVGDVLYRVGSDPVFLIEGSEPFWRDLGVGAKGADVAQVQKFLADNGARISTDGVWGAGTSAAVREWQRHSGLSRTGTIAVGTLIAVPHLPSMIEVDPAVLWPGAVLTGGEVVAKVAQGDPTFVMELTSSQAELIPAGTAVSVQFEDEAWPGVAGESTPTDAGVSIPVTGTEGGPVCGAQCAALPPAAQTYLLTDVAVEEPATGPVVPVAALTTGPEGTITVERVDVTGTTTSIPVQVSVIANGLAVVDGIPAGERVRVFGSAQPTATPNPTERESGEPSASPTES